ncbi:RNA chaperone Hfq [Herbaspirillum huttiense]|uniref:Uncharacterized protein n=1 Tax=Herbaspirillum huttiense subsp. lycopersici TaxID=3074428 RepID=A0ABU2EFS5_9BURK|nr:RNA chaperone Hfq [Herbaspirillum huttiense]MDR9846991.1 hypothetical protein [Herbaspirillum huttiense SE1]
MNHHAPRGSLAAVESATREEQLQVGRKMAEAEDATPPRTTLSLPAGAARRGDFAPVVTSPYRTAQSRPPARPVAPRAGGQQRTMKGHEAFLKALITSGASIRVEKCDGRIYIGQIKHSDKYTITMTADGADRVIFKHDISEFSAASARQSGTESEGKHVN